MKKFLLFAAAALMVTSASAQLKAPVVRSKGAINKEKLSQLPKPQKMDLSQISSTREMTNPDMSAQSLVNLRAPKKAGYLEAYYKRPAGMYVSPFNANNGEGLWSFGDMVFLMAKPFADYLFTGEISGEVDETTSCAWDIWIRPYGGYIGLDNEIGFYYNSYWSVDSVPIFYAVDGPLDDQNANWFEYQIRGYDTEENVGGGVTVNSVTPARILTVDNNETVALMFEDGENMDFMYSSKTMISGGRNADQVGMLSRYYGAEPWGDNEYGWWFGKNASHVDGMAQCFEKPQHPYLLKNVYLQAANNYQENIGMVVNNNVKMYCKVYKLSEIPDYQEVGGARLPMEPGELIVTGEATVTPTTGEALNGLITFTLKANDPVTGLTYEYHPTIDYPIMITIEGYNDPGMEDLVEFSAFVSVDDQVDEGYGELCYLKTGIFETEIDEHGDTVYDEEGNPVEFFTGEYQWRGLNNYFSGGTLTLKTGLSIFIGTENPFLTFEHGYEDGEYTFPEEGGPMSDTFEYSDGSVYVTDGVVFFSSVPGEDGDMWMTWNGQDELPDWLEINLVDTYDEETGEFTNEVVAQVTAEPLPDNLQYRSAVIRFEIAGDFIDFKFKQGEAPDPIPGDVDGNGEVNIADVNCLIKVILGQVDADIYEGRADVNEDDEVNIADVNAVIAIILKG